jgi:hypothetical protein
MKTSVAITPLHDLLVKKPEWLDGETTAAVRLALFISLFCAGGWLASPH